MFYTSRAGVIIETKVYNPSWIIGNSTDDLHGTLNTSQTKLQSNGKFNL